MKMNLQGALICWWRVAAVTTIHSKRLVPGVKSLNFRVMSIDTNRVWQLREISTSGG